VLKGYGDPTLSSSDLRTLAWKIRAQGVRRVVGPIVGDESFFDARRTAPGWRSWFSGAYCAPISALAVRGRASRRPALAAAESFRAALRAAGVSVTGPATPGRARASAAVLATTASAPLSSLLSLVNRESDNFAAEVLLKHLGAVQLGRGSTAAGATVVRETLGVSRVPLAGVRVVDGSGLSLRDRSTATALATILVAAWNDPYLRRPFVRSLAIAGRNGTLVRRLRTPPAAGRVLAKTGTTRQSSALAGYVGDRYAFAIIQNGSPVSWHWARVAQDRFVSVLAAQ
jgi:serine-type D-Ala-D-Ala carboxypeptidase/endopeptidase (penicillin-binding protein 4)